MRSHELTAARLPTRRTGSRYRIEGVDAFLEECATALTAYERGRVPVLRSNDVVTAVSFGTVSLFGTGYDADAVDQLFDEVALQLREYEPESVQDAQEAELREMLERVRRLGEHKD